MLIWLVISPLVSVHFMMHPSYTVVGFGASIFGSGCLVEEQSVICDCGHGWLEKHVSVRLMGVAISLSENQLYELTMIRHCNTVRQPFTSAHHRSNTSVTPACNKTNN
ncbi:hypothetical protein DFH28DRAFT_927043 [Melampsora americana]|nr:hypothetical protein DFH28DRAFT_927043 [Melampsora americana]